MKTGTRVERDLKAHARKLLADYAANGHNALRRMRRGEPDLLLSELHIYLAEASGRCRDGVALDVNVPLKGYLENQIRDVAGFIARQNERELELEM